MCVSDTIITKLTGEELFAETLKSNPSLKFEFYFIQSEF